MQRRDFLKNAAYASLLFSSPLSLARRAGAQGARPDYFWFMVDARGAWDPTRSLDPKGGEPFNSHFGEGEIRTTSTGIRYAPMSRQGGALVDYMSGAAGARTPFFERYKEDLVILNGLDTKTNSHDVGPRHVWSGTLRNGSPNIGALMAAIKERDLEGTMPLGFLSTGGYDNTSRLLPVARAQNPALLNEITQPNFLNATRNYLSDELTSKVRGAESQRRDSVDLDSYLPAIRESMRGHWSSRDVEVAFGGLNRALGELDELSAAQAANRGIVAARLAIAGMIAGVCSSAMLSIATFDTHADHDVNQPLRQQELFDTIDYVATTMRAVGLYDRTVITVGSDFGRTIYNGLPGDNTRGKDHWPITSMMALGGPIAGGRVIGITDKGPLEADAARNTKGHKALPLRVEGGELVQTEAADPNGLIVSPEHVHQALRRLARVEGDAISDRFPLELTTPVLPLFE